MAAAPSTPHRHSEHHSEPTLRFTCELIGSRRVGPFHIGMALPEAVTTLQRHGMQFRHVRVVFDKTRPLARDVVLHLVHHGIRLCFEPVQQRLRVVDVYDVSRVDLEYSGTVFSGPSLPVASRSQSSPLFWHEGRGGGGGGKVSTPRTPSSRAEESSAATRASPSFRLSADSPRFSTPTGTPTSAARGARGGGAATFRAVLDMFGPNAGGYFSADRSQYVHQYPGITFVVSIPERYREEMHLVDDLVPEFADGYSPFVTRVLVYYEPTLSLPPLPRGWEPGVDLYFEPVQVLVNQGIFFTVRGKQVTLWCSYAQDLLSDLGPPSLVSKKQGDKLKIYASAQASPSLQPKGAPYSSAKRVQSLTPSASPTLGPMHASPGTNSPDAPPDEMTHMYCDYYFNYYEHGIDFLLDGCSHMVKKVVLHTNLPGSREFNRYRKCNFFLTLPDSVQAPPDAPEIGADSVWDDVLRVFGPTQGKPMVLHPSRRRKEFGTTTFHPYNGIIFEVMDDTAHLSSVTLFRGAT